MLSGVWGNSVLSVAEHGCEAAAGSVGATELAVTLSAQHLELRLQDRSRSRHIALQGW